MQVIEVGTPPTEEMKQARAKAAAEGFHEQMSRPEVKFLISMIKPTEPAEVLETLLQAFFGAGFMCGGHAAMEEVGKNLVESLGGALKRLADGESGEETPEGARLQ